MTISSTVRVAGPYSGNDATVTFSFAFKVFTAADVQVILTDSTDTESVLTLTTDYTVTLNGNQDTNPGGSVTLLVAPATGEKLTVTSAQASYQSVNLANQGGFYPDVLNNQLDKLAINIQQCERDIAQAARVPLSSDIDPDIVSDALMTVATSIGDVETVAGSIGDVGTVATNIANVNLVGGDIANVNSVAGDLANIDAVAGDLTNIDTVAADIASVNTCASNIVAIQSAPAYAAAAAASADESEAYANLSLAANESAEAAASASGSVLFYDTKSAANSALAGLAEGQIVEVMADESVSGLRTRYRKTIGAYVFKIIIGEAKVSTVASLRAIPYSAMLTTAETLGSLASGDGGGGTWRWDATSTATDNGGVVVLPTGYAGTGRWVRQFDGAVNASWFGVYKNGTGVGVASLVAGRQYIITTVGTTDFTLLGAASNAIGVVFTATGAGTGTGVCALDSWAGLQAALDYAQYQAASPKHGTVTIPSGQYAISDVLSVGYGISGYTGVTVQGEGGAYRGQFPGTVINTYFTDRPAIAVQGARNTRIKGIAICGRNAAYIDSAQIGQESSSYHIRLSTNWADASFADSPYKVHCAIAIDPYSGTKQATSYPNVTYPSWLGVVAQYGKTMSSDVLIEDCYLYGFVAGCVIQPCYEDGNGDFVRFSNTWFEKLKWGVSVGNTQSRLVRLDYCNFTSVHTALLNTVHGKGPATGQAGRLITHADSCHFNQVTQWVSLNMAQSGPVQFTGCYCESTWRLGNVRIGASRAAALTFDSCLLSFAWQKTHYNFGIPDFILQTDAAEHTIDFNNCQFNNYYSVLPFYGAGCVNFNGCDTWVPTRLQESIQRKAFSNATLGGIVIPLSQVPGVFSVKSDALYSLDNGTSDLGTGVPTRGTYDRLPSRSYCLNIYARFANYWQKQGYEWVQVNNRYNLHSPTLGTLNTSARKISAQSVADKGTTVWAANDTVTFSGADWLVPAVFKVASVAGGTPTFSIVEPGTYTGAAEPANPVAPASATVADGGGYKSDATFTLTFEKKAVITCDLSSRAFDEPFAGGMKGDIVTYSGNGSVFVIDSYDAGTRIYTATLLNNYYLDSSGDVQLLNSISMSSGTFYLKSSRNFVVGKYYYCDITSGSPTLTNVKTGNKTNSEFDNNFYVNDYVYYDEVKNYVFKNGAKITARDSTAYTLGLSGNAASTISNYELFQMCRIVP